MKLKKSLKSARRGCTKVEKKNKHQTIKHHSTNDGKRRSERQDKNRREPISHNVGKKKLETQITEGDKSSDTEAYRRAQKEKYEAGRPLIESRKSSENRHSVTPLDSHGDTLPEKQRGARVARKNCEAFAQLNDKLQCSRTPDAHRLTGMNL